MKPMCISRQTDTFHGICAGGSIAPLCGGFMRVKFLGVTLPPLSAVLTGVLAYLGGMPVLSFFATPRKDL